MHGPRSRWVNVVNIDQGQLMTSRDSTPNPTSLEEVVRCVQSAGQGDTVSVRDMLEAVGPRSFGPVLLVPAMIILSPVSGIPTVPTLGAIVITLIALQLMIGRHHVWLPRWLLRRTLKRSRLDGAARFLTPIARVADKVTRPRLEIFTRPPFRQLIALLCILTAATMPMLEPVPFMATTAGAVITVYALALVARDGLLALVALMLSAAAGVVLLR